MKNADAGREESLGGRLSPGASVVAPPDDLARYFEREILPLLTPVLLDAAHPLPPYRDGAIHLAVRFKPAGKCPRIGVVVVPALLPRVVTVGSEVAGLRFGIEEIIASHLGVLFPGAEISECWTVHVQQIVSPLQPGHLRSAA